MFAMGKRFHELFFMVAIACFIQHPALLYADCSVTEMSGETVLRIQEDKSKQRKDEKDKKKKKEDEKKKDNEEDGALGEFEKDATGKKREANQEGDSSQSSGWWLFIGEVFAIALIGGAVGSWYRVSGTPVDEDLDKYWGIRQPGEPSLPFIGLNFNYQNVSSDVEAFDGSFEGGYGPLGVRYRFTRFKEENPPDELDFSWLHGMLRFTYTKYMEVGLGFGGIFLDGKSSESGFSFMFPIRVEPSQFFGLYYYPTWGWINGNTISDYDLGLRLGIRYVSIRGGYRWTKAGNSTLEGPILGLLFSY